MARTEQVLVLEPQHELKFRGKKRAGPVDFGFATASRQLTLAYIQAINFNISVSSLANVMLFG